LPVNRFCNSGFAPRLGKCSFTCNLHFIFIPILAALCLLAPQLARAQQAEAALAGKAPLEMESAPATSTPPPAAAPAETNLSSKQPVESDLTVEGLASYGHYKIFASGSSCHLYTGGVEYDRHSWGTLLKARVDYVAEFLPVVLLDAPVTQDIWGSPTTPDHHIVPGVGFSPIGFRMLWRGHKAIKPYLTAKGGMLLFPEKVLSQESTYVNFSLQSAMGVQARLKPRVDLRLGLFSDFHFSNGFIVPVNPGLDVMNANLGITYHLGK
jgi:hypothetical protein